MAENDDFDGNHNFESVTGCTSFSQLLFEDEDGDEHHREFDKNHNIPNYSGYAIDDPPNMLCFGKKEVDEAGFAWNTRQKSGVTCSDSSSASSGNNCSSLNLTLPTSNSKLKKRSGLDQEAPAIGIAPVNSQRALKKFKTDAPPLAGHAKRKEKLGDRITALQQLVSPFGKTDTASVLHEATGYIKFLHEQVHILCSPYLHYLPSLSATERKTEEMVAKSRDLRSRGLCLIPVDCSIHLADCTVADFWSPSMGKSL